MSEKSSEGKNNIRDGGESLTDDKRAKLFEAGSAHYDNYRERYAAMTDDEFIEEGTGLLALKGTGDMMPRLNADVREGIRLALDLLIKLDDSEQPDPVSGLVILGMDAYAAELAKRIAQNVHTDIVLDDNESQARKE